MNTSKQIKIILPILLSLSQTPFLSAQTATHAAYIEEFYKIAVLEMERTNIPASIKLAQGILESGLGRSELAQKANNHFGIKCGNDWTGATYYIEDDDTDETGKIIKSCFRAFDAPQESYVEHTEFLADPRKAFRYGALFQLDKTDYKGWAEGLKAAGYATNPNYPKLLTNIIEANNLTRFDVMTTADLDATFVQSYPQQREEIQNRKYTRVQEFNKVKFVFAREGDTPNDVGTRFNVSTRNILLFNDIDGVKIFELNERVFLENKRWRYKGNAKFHRVQTGETMQSIGQLYAVKTSWLYARNRMKDGTQPAVGEQIQLRGINFKTVKTRKPDAATPSRPTSKPTSEPTSEPTTNDGFLDEIVPPSAQKITHTVIAGDTLYGLARKYGVPIDTIRKLNNLTSDALKVGQELRIKN